VFTDAMKLAAELDHGRRHAVDQRRVFATDCLASVVMPGLGRLSEFSYIMLCCVGANLVDLLRCLYLNETRTQSRSRKK
jgi:hypothetical protein